jgi:putative ABC transport system permease protein
MLLPVPDLCQYNFRPQDVERCFENPFSQLWIRLDAADPEAGMASVLDVLGSRGDVSTISVLYDFTFLLRRRTVQLFGIIAFALLFIGTVNAFAVGLTTVAQRTPGIGTRRALGAGRLRTGLSSLLRLLGLTAIGVIAGSGLAFWMASAFEQLLSIPLRFGSLHFAGAGLLVGTALLAGALPAFRASRIPPVRAIRLDPLRHEKRPLQGWGWLITVACVVGISSVLFVVALSDSIAAAYRQMYGNLEPNVVSVVGGRSVPGRAETGYELQRNDLDAIFGVPGITSIAAERSLVSVQGYAEDGTILYDQTTFEGQEVMGTLVEVLSIGDAFLAGSLVEGRIPTSREFADGAHVIVLSKKVADATFGALDPLGKTITFGSAEFVIIGVINAPKTNVAGASQWMMMVPAGAIENELSLGYRAWVRMDPAVNVETTVDNIRAVLGGLHPGSAPAQIEGPAQEMGRMIALANSVTLGSLRLGMLALIVSAFGLGSLFWAQTMRRRRQIGIRRAVGATAMDVSFGVFRQALLTTAVAGVLSMGVAILGVRLLADWFFFDVSFQWQWLVWTAAVVLIAASIGGGIPALWAARLSPMDTIRFRG